MDLIMHELQMSGWLIINMIHGTGKIMIKALIEILYRGNYLGIISGEKYTLRYILLHRGVLERSLGVETWFGPWK